jgi:hypothetical protein
MLAFKVGASMPETSLPGDRSRQNLKSAADELAAFIERYKADLLTIMPLLEQAQLRLAAELSHRTESG